MCAYMYAHTHTHTYTHIIICIPMLSPMLYIHYIRYDYTVYIITILYRSYIYITVSTFNVLQYYITRIYKEF